MLIVEFRQRREGSREGYVERAFCNTKSATKSLTRKKRIHHDQRVEFRDLPSSTDLTMRVATASSWSRRRPASFAQSGIEAPLTVDWRTTKPKRAYGANREVSKGVEARGRGDKTQNPQRRRINALR